MRWIGYCGLASVLAASACAQEGGGGAPAAAERTIKPAATTAPSDARSGPRSPERQAERERMVEWHIASRDVDDPVVLEAMRNVPRHWFVPKSAGPMAYADHPLTIGHGQTISQPYIVALMTEALALKPEDKVLEIGTGSGYQAAVLAEITSRVFTIEIVEPLARRAAETFKRHGYDTITAKAGDGYAGWPEFAPFDAIIVTCAPEDIPAKLVEQLAVGGRMCIPVGRQGRVQQLVLVVKRSDGRLERRMIAPVTFVPMTGGGKD